MAEFVTDIFLVTSRDTDTDTFILDTTCKGNDGNLYESSWRHKGRRLLGFKKNPDDEFVVTDLTVITEDKDVPDEYAGVLITKHTREKGLKKHILCYSRGERKTSSEAITEIYLVNESKSENVPANFTSVSETVNDIQICFKKQEIPKIKKPAPPIPPPQQAQNIMTASKMTHISGIDGVPFQINPKFNISSSGSDPLIAGMMFVSPDEIERKYQYSFNIEKDATRN